MNKKDRLILVPSLEGARPLIPDDLPPPETKRWVASRKTQLVLAVRGGLLERREVLDRYGISDEEFQCWMSAYEKRGAAGLRATRGARRPSK